MGNSRRVLVVSLIARPTPEESNLMKMKLLLLCAVMLPLALADECGNMLPPKICKEITRAGYEVGLAVQSTNFALGNGIKRIENQTNWILKSVSMILGNKPEIRDDLIKLTPELQKLGKEQEEQKKAVVVKFRKAIWDASYYISMDFALLSEEVQKLIGKGYTSEEIKERLQAMVEHEKVLQDLVMDNLDGFRRSQLKFGHKYIAIFKDFLGDEDFTLLNEWLEQFLHTAIIKSQAQDDLKGIHYHIQNIIDIMAKLATDLEKGIVTYGLSLEDIKAAIGRMTGKLVASIKQRTMEVLAKNKDKIMKALNELGSVLIDTGKEIVKLVRDDMTGVIIGEVVG